MLTKRCARCGEVKPWAEFWAMRRYEDGSVRQPQAYCKPCSRRRRTELRAQEPHAKLKAQYTEQYRRIREDPERWAERLGAARERRRQLDEVQERRRTQAREYARRKYNYKRHRGPCPNAQGKPRTRGEFHAGSFRDPDGPLTWENAVWADGNAVMAWLTYHFPEYPYSSERCVSRWRQTGVARIDAVDRLMTRVGAHISELPDDVWRRRRDA